MANRKKYLTEFKARLCSVMACTLADIADLVHRLPRERELEVSSYTSYSDKEIRNIAHTHRHKIYLEVSSQTFKRHFPQMKKIDEFKCSAFAKIVIFMITIGFDNNEIARYLDYRIDEVETKEGNCVCGFILTPPLFPVCPKG